MEILALINNKTLNTMNFKNILQQFKTTILGLLLVAAGLYLLISKVVSSYIAVGLIIFGVALWFCPDHLVNTLEKLVFGKVLFDKSEKKTNPNESGQK